MTKPGTSLLGQAGVFALLLLGQSVQGDPFTTGPLSRTNDYLTDATFVVTATGTSPFAYQWRKNGSALADGGNVHGVATVSLTVSAVAYTDAGSYDCVVTNSVGSITSSVAVLTVRDPIITSQPASRTNNAGTTATFSVGASGSEVGPASLVYDNTTNRSTPALFAQTGGIEFGDEIVLASSGPRVLTNFMFEYYGLNFSGNETLQFRIYANDALYGTNFYAPGTVLYDSGTNAISATSAATLSFDLQVLVPTDFTWTVQFGGIEAGESAGLSLYSPAGTGSNPVDYWERSGTNDTWLLFGPQTPGPALNFGARAYAYAGPLTYRWLRNGVPLDDDGVHLAGATTPTLTITNVAQVDATNGAYTVAVTGADGTLTSDPATLTVIDPPVITAQPAGRTNNAGTDATFTVTLTGTAPFSYQWRKNGSDLSEGGKVSGATTATLTLSGVLNAEEGSYSVQVMNPAGAEVSSGAVLLVVDPVINTQPVSRTNNAGTVATFSVGAAGTGLSYQWKKGGVNLSNGGTVSGATTAALTLGNVAQVDATNGAYTVAVTGADGTLTSDPATLTVIDPPVITAQPVSRTNDATTVATFGVTVTGTAPFSYQWRKNGVNLVNGGNVAGATSASLAVTGVLNADEGSYSVQVTNPAASLVSSGAVLVVVDPVINTQPVSRTNNAGTVATFSVGAAGTALTYQWKKGGVNMSDGGAVSGATTAHLTLSTLVQSDAATYTVAVTGGDGTLTSDPATLTVIDGPVITAQPVSRTNNAATVATFGVTVTGTVPFSYQWRKNGSDLSEGGKVSGATTATLTLTGVLNADEGSYSVQVMNPAGTGVSSAAVLVVVDPVINTQPVSRTNNAGTVATFSVGAAGTGLSYQWRKGGVNLSDGGTVSGATTAALTLANVSQADATNGAYTVAVTGADGTLTSDPATLTVIDPPVITAQPAGRTNNAGTDATFTVTLTGTAPFSYQWRKNGSDLSEGGKVSGATTATLTLSGVLNAEEGSYSVQVMNPAGAEVSSGAVLLVVDPVINTQPVSRTNNAGTVATFSVGAAGTGLSYQWKKGGVNLSNGGTVSGATTAALTLGNVAQVDATNGAYTVAVTGADGTLTSDPATLTVIDPPVITAQPVSRTNDATTVATFGVTVTGTAPFSYQWRKNGVNLVNGGNVAGATSASLAVTGVLNADEGSYSVQVTNPAASLVSSGAVLVVVDPVINTQPVSRTNNAGTVATFSVGAAGTALTYQWKKGGVNMSDGGAVSGATTAHLTLSTLVQSDAATYTVAVTGGDGTLTSDPATLTVIDGPVITAQPVSRTNNAATVATFGVTVTGTVPFSYQWRKNGSDLSEGGKVSGATTATLTLTGVLNADEGSYSVQVMNPAGTGVSSAAVLVVVDPVINTQPVSRTNNAGTVATFSVGAAGTGLSYQWRKGGVNLSDGGTVSGATTAALTLANVSQADATNGAYTVAVTGADGTLTSDPATLTVIDPPVITAQPAGRTNNAGTDATFTVTLTGTAPFSYQWRKNGSDLSEGGKVSGATTATLTLSGVLNAEEGSYSVQVMNPAGAEVSSGAVLLVVDPVINTQPVSRTNNAGTVATFSVGAAGTGLSYQWKKGGVNLSNGGTVSGATTAALTLGNVAQVDATNGAYTVAVTGADGTLTSDPATLTVIDPPVITAQPVSRTNDATTVATFGVTVTGTAPFSYQWRKNGVNLVNGGNVAGATSASLAVTGVLNADEGSYSVQVTNPAASLVSSGAVLVVVDPVINTQPVSRTNNAGTVATFSVGAAGTALTYQWKKGGVNMSDGGAVSGATTAHLTLSTLVQSDAATYTVAVTGGDGTLTSDPATLTVIDGPVITAQPVSRTNNAATVATFGVTVTGTVPFSYQWRKNGSDLSEGGKVSGATTATLTLTGVLNADEGSYSVQVMNPAGTGVSSAAVLVVVDPVINTQPVSRTNNAGTVATFSVGAAGTGLSYQWRKGGVNLSDGGTVSGATTAALTLANVSQADATNGAYTVAVTGADGTLTSDPATLTVIDPPVITAQPAGRTNNAGTDATFTVTLTGTAPFSYQWRKNGSDLSEGGKVSGATTATLTLSGVLNAEEGSYSVQVMNPAGAEVSSGAVLLVVDPVINTQPVSRTNNAGTVATFSVGAAGTGLSYQWKKGGVNLSNGGTVSGATTANLTLATVAQTDVASYSVEVTGADGTIASGVATLTVIDPPVITGQPGNRGNNAGTTAAFTVTVTGTEPFSYQWRKNGVNLVNGDNVSGATSASLAVTGVLNADEGSYSVMVTNPADSVISRDAVLVVTDPVINTQPVSRTNNAGTTATFNVTANGTALTYRWLKNGANLSDAGNVSGATTAHLTLSTVAQSDAATYTVDVTGGDGTLTTDPATLTVVDQPVITAQPVGRTNNAGTTATFAVTVTGTTPFNYRWMRNGSDLTDGGNVSGATSATLLLSGVLNADEGSYSVLVDNPAGVVLSTNAILRVVDPVINTQPASRTNNAGTTARFSVQAAGTALTYEWKRNGASLSDGGSVSGVTTPELTVSSVAQANAGSYTVDVTGADGTVASAIATLAVIDPPVITGQPASRGNDAGTAATFSVVVSGTAPFTYLWTKNGVDLHDGGNVSGATTATLTVSGVLAADAGSYSVLVANPAGSELSRVALLTVVDPVINAQPVSRTNNAGTTATFSVGAAGTALTYQWKNNGGNLTNGGHVSGATSAQLTVSSVAQSDAGSYTVDVTGGNGMVGSAVATLTVIDPPVITVQPASRTNNATTVATFAVTVSGTAPFSYQWLRNGSDLTDGGKVSGATTAALTIASVLAADAGSYRVLVANVAGSALSSSAVLTVVDPVITNQPASRTNDAGTTATFSVGAAGTALTYQWRKDGINLVDGGNISGATTADLVLSSVAESDAGTYAVVVAGTAGSVLSSAATLTVFDLAVLVYNNMGVAPSIQRFAQNGFEFGDEVHLLGDNGRFLSRFIFEYYGLNFSGDEMLRFRIYRNDGALFGGSAYSPGQLLYDSGDFAITATPGLALTMTDLHVSVPDSFTWTVQFSGVGAGESAGLTLYDPPTHGTNYPGYWERSGVNDSWVSLATNSVPPANFSTRIYAVDTNVCALFANAPISPLVAGHQPTGIWLGNLRGDGNSRDIVVANSGDNTVGVFLFLGNGNFANAGTYSVGRNPQAVRTGDFNGGGTEDIAVANYGDNSVTVLLNLSGGLLFGVRADYPVGAGPKAISSGDLDHDGRLDLVTANALGNSVSILFSSGGGLFDGAHVVTYPVGSGPNSVALSDLNGDGWVDILTANKAANSLTILTNKHDRTFDYLHSTIIALPPGSQPACALAGKFYGANGIRDEVSDIAVAAAGSDSVQVLFGQTNAGRWSVQDQLILPLSGGASPQSLLLRDLNRDGLLDLVVANGGSNNVQVFLHQSDGAFNSSGTVVVGGRPAIVVGSNFNEDSAADFAVTMPADNRISVLLYSGTLADALTVTVREDEQPPAVQLLKGRNLDGDQMDYYIMRQGSNGTATVLGTGPGFIYTPDASNFFGSDSFTYYATPVGQPDLKSVPATVTVKILSVNDSPSFSFTQNFLQQGKTVAVIEDAAVTSALIVDPNTLSWGGEPYEPVQRFAFMLTPADRTCFASQPTIDPKTGLLSFRPALNRTTSGMRVAVQLRDSGGTANGGVNLSPVQEFWIQIQPNPLKPVQGVYNGLFYEVDGLGVPIVRHQTAGSFTLTMVASGSSANGAFTGKLTGEGGSYGFSGRFDQAGHALAPVLRPNNSTLYLDLSLDLSGPNGDRVSGSVTAEGGVWTANHLEGYRAAFGAVNSAPWVGRYTMAFLGAHEDAAVYPGGDGYAILTVSSTGNVSVNGKLGDGTSFSQATSLSRQGLWPFYVLLYGKQGSALGWLKFAEAPSSLGLAATNRPLNWIKPAMTGRFYPAGFTTQLFPLGSAYTVPFPPGAPLYPGEEVVGHLSLMGGNLVSEELHVAALTSANEVVGGFSAPYFRLVSPATGVMAGQFFDRNMSASRSLRGVVLKDQKMVRGYFPGVNQTGAAVFQP